jgi:hypothetical protein
LIEDSDKKIFFLFLIRGIKDNKLISNPIQILNQDIEEILINVPNINENINKNLKENLKIKKKRSKTFIYRV